MLNILVADDSNFHRKLMNSYITDIGHHCIEVCDGLEAFNATVNQSIDMIFMDISMPVMNGYEACKKIKAHKRGKFIPIIFTTGLDDIDTMVEALATGGDDFIIKPIEEVVVASKLKAHHRTLSLFSQIDKANTELNIYRKMIDREHNIVEKIFEKGITENNSACKNIKCHTSPASMFNGDLLLVSSSPSGGVYVLAGDFTGHGLAAAIGCIPAANIFFSMSQKKANVSDIAVALNDSLLALLPDNMFFCAAIIEMNSQGNRLSIWLGGMNDILLVDNQGGIDQRIASKHMPLGILSRSEFKSVVDIVSPSQNQKLYIYTDGIIEAKNPQRELFGEDRLDAIIETTLDGYENNRIDRIFEAVATFQEGEKQGDDFSIVEITCTQVIYSHEKYLNDTSFNNILLSTPKIILPWHINTIITPENMRQNDILEQLSKLISSIKGFGVHKDLLTTIIGELYNNALEYGILLLDPTTKISPDGFENYYKLREQRLSELKSGSIKFSISVESQYTGTLKISFSDTGPGFDVHEKIDQHRNGPLQYYGRGINLVRSLCDTLEYSDAGRTVSATFSLKDLHGSVN
ncbi:MAG: fused response regulator/phosphatase [Pseudomonadales bacterium]